LANIIDRLSSAQDVSPAGRQNSAAACKNLTAAAAEEKFGDGSYTGGFGLRPSIIQKLQSR